MNPLLHGHRSLILLGALLLIVLTSPLGDGEGPQSLILVAGILVLGLAGAFLLARNRALFCGFSVVVLLAIGLETLAGQVFEGVAPMRVFAGVMALLSSSLLFFFVINYSLLLEGVKKVDRIVAGICGYLLLGFMWSTLNLSIDTVIPNSFRDVGGGELVRSDYLYHSLVTLSTLGYGDIVPVRKFARIVSALEAVFGTLYLAIFISSLVSGMGRKNATSSK